MKIIIVGCGVVGTMLAQQLSLAGHDLVAVDSSTQLVERIINAYDVNGVIGNGASADVLHEAGVGNADLLIACTHQDELNILCCFVAKKLGARQTIARVRNPEYFNLFMSTELGLSMMVNPEYEAAQEIFRVLRFPTAAKVEFFADGKVELIELPVEQGSCLDGVTPAVISQKAEGPLLICALRRGEEVLIPKGHTTLMAGDSIYITAQPKTLQGWLRSLKMYKTHKRIRRVMILGGNRIAYYLTKQLSGLGYEVKIVESDYNRCMQLADLFPGVRVICADSTEDDLLSEEGLGAYDALVSLKESEEENLIHAMVGATYGMEKVIALVNREPLSRLADASHNCSVISLKTLTSSQILRYVRGLERSSGSDMVSLYRFMEEGAEMVEFAVGDRFRHPGVPIRDLKLRDNVLIACILRGEQMITPRGGDYIQAGDRVILVTSGLQVLDLDDIFL